MTPTLLAGPRRPSPSPRKPGRWAGVAFGLLAGVLAICHGCHLGDHDDELSARGGEKRAAGFTPAVQTAGTSPAARPAGTGVTAGAAP